MLNTPYRSEAGAASARPAVDQSTAASTERAAHRVRLDVVNGIPCGSTHRVVVHSAALCHATPLAADTPIELRLLDQQRDYAPIGWPMTTAKASLILAALAELIEARAG
jgi:hypothetical protein